MVLVKLVRIGKEAKEYEISADPTVAGLLRAAGVTYKPGTITVDHEPVDSGYELDDGDDVFIGDACKGNQDTVKIIRLGSSEAVVEFHFEAGMTINGLLNSLPADQKAKFFNADGNAIYEYRINGGEAVGGDTTLPSGTGAALRLVMSTRTKGNK